MVKTDKVNGAILPAQIKSVDAGTRNLKFITKVNAAIVNETIRKVSVLIGAI